MATTLSTSPAPDAAPAADPPAPERQPRRRRWLSRISVAGAVLLVGVLLLARFDVPEGHSAVVARFGRPVRVIDAPGIHLNWPAPIEQVRLVDRRLSLLGPPGLELLTADKRNIVAEVFVVYQVSDTMQFVQAVGTRSVGEAHLVDLVVAHLGAQVGQHEFLAFLGSPRVVSQILDSVRSGVDQKARQELGIAVKRIGFRRLSFPKQNVASVIRRMRAEREKIASSYRSQGQERAMSIEAEGIAEEGRLLAQAKEESLKIKAAADAESAQIYTESYARDADLFRFLKTLETSEAALKDRSTVFLPYDSQFLDPLLRGK